MTLRRQGLAGCQVLEWDSAFFGCRIARIDSAALKAHGPAAVDAWCRGEAVACACLLVDAGDQDAITAAERGGYRLVDLRVTLEAEVRPPRVSPPPGAVVVRAAVPEDVPVLEAIARKSHRTTRFYVDGRFDRARCDELYAHWIARSCAGWADAVFVACAGAHPIGYLSCHVRADRGEVGLVGVEAEHRGQGAASALVDAAFGWCAGRNLARLQVATQARNQPGLALYRARGFTLRALALWYHRWL